MECQHSRVASAGECFRDSAAVSPSQSPPRKSLSGAGDGNSQSPPPLALPRPPSYVGTVRAPAGATPTSPTLFADRRGCESRDLSAGRPMSHSRSIISSGSMVELGGRERRRRFLTPEGVRSANTCSPECRLYSAPSDLRRRQRLPRRNRSPPQVNRSVQVTPSLDENPHESRVRRPCTNTTCVRSRSQSPGVSAKWAAALDIFEGWTDADASAAPTSTPTSKTTSRRSETTEPEPKATPCPHCGSFPLPTQPPKEPFEDKMDAEPPSTAGCACCCKEARRIGAMLRERKRLAPLRDIGAEVQLLDLARRAVSHCDRPSSTCPPSPGRSLLPPPPPPPSTPHSAARDPVTPYSRKGKEDAEKGKKGKESKGKGTKGKESKEKDDMSKENKGKEVKGKKKKKKDEIAPGDEDMGKKDRGKKDKRKEDKEKGKKRKDAKGKGDEETEEKGEDEENEENSDKEVSGEESSDMDHGLGGKQVPRSHHGHRGTHAKGSRRETRGPHLEDGEELPVSITYRLSDYRFMEMGWTVLPPENVDPFVVTYQSKPHRRPYIWVNPTDMNAPGQGSAHDKFYDDGKPFVKYFENGSFIVFYPDGQNAIILKPSKRGEVLEVFSLGELEAKGKMRRQQLLAVFDTDGNGVVYDDNGNLRLHYTQEGGALEQTASGRPAKWRWPVANVLDAMRPAAVSTKNTPCTLTLPRLVTQPERRQLKRAPQVPASPALTPSSALAPVVTPASSFAGQGSISAAGIRDVDDRCSQASSSIGPGTASEVTRSPSDVISDPRISRLRSNCKKGASASSSLADAAGSSEVDPLAVPAALLLRTPEDQIFYPRPGVWPRDPTAARAREHEAEMQRLLNTPVAPPKIIVLRLNDYLAFRLLNQKRISLEMRPNNQRRFLRVQLGRQLQPGIVIRVEEVDSRTAEGNPPASVTLLKRNVMDT